MTTIQLSFHELLSMLGGLIVFFLGALWLFGQIIVRQFKSGLDERFKSLDQKRETGAQAIRDLGGQMQSLERDFLSFRAELPLQYVRREDYVRNQTVIEAKLDGLALRFENLMLKGVPHHD